MTTTKEEILASPSGTRFTKVKCYNGEGDLCGIDYIPRDNNPDYDDDLENAKAIAPGYFTETSHIKRV